MPVVAGALVDAAGRVLLQRRPPGKQLADLWEFPGGKVEPGETPEAALVRELAEELAIRVDPAALTAVTFASAGLGDRHLLLLLYVVRAWQGTPQPLEASALAWVRPADMAALPMPPADVPLVAMLCRLDGFDG
ncbi:(deoxy)nucleoside triphosphate pyrophosphohydrolase [Sphingomonas sp. A2-49]|nr:(deoxy)nucleoside triphosphate pyrophosphohydrolase [Sphingomonas sp. A2-49]